MHIKSIIFDMDGVLWSGNTPIVDLKSTFETINDKGYKYAFATNNSSSTLQNYVDKLSNFGIPVNKDQIFTSATATADFLAIKYPDGGNLYIIGAQGLKDILSQRGFSHSKYDCLAVISGIDREVDYTKLSEASLLVRSGVPFIGTNPDKSFPTPEGQLPGAGAIQAAIEAASGVSPLIIGKPEKILFNQAIEYLDCPPEEILMIGDRLETDIAGGQSVHCKTGLVLSGVTTLDDAKKWSPKINIIANDLSEMVTKL